MRLHALAMDFAGALGADFIGDEAVGGGVDGGGELGPEAVEGSGFETAFENGVLHAQAPVFADAGDAVEALGRGDIVGDEGEHLGGAAAVAGKVAGGGEEGWKPIGGERGGSRRGRGRRRKGEAGRKNGVGERRPRRRRRQWARHGAGLAE